jgi:hypothetical protein
MQAAREIDQAQRDIDFRLRDALAIIHMTGQSDRAIMQDEFIDILGVLAQDLNANKQVLLKANAEKIKLIRALSVTIVLLCVMLVVIICYAIILRLPFRCRPASMGHAGQWAEYRTVLHALI